MLENRIRVKRDYVSSLQWIFKGLIRRTYIHSLLYASYPQSHVYISSTQILVTRLPENMIYRLRPKFETGSNNLQEK